MEKGFEIWEKFFAKKYSSLYVRRYKGKIYKFSYIGTQYIYSVCKYFFIYIPFYLWKIWIFPSTLLSFFIIIHRIFLGLKNPKFSGCGFYNIFVIVGIYEDTEKKNYDTGFRFIKKV